MRVVLIAAFAAAIAGGCAARAQGFEKKEKIGRWLVTVTEDRFNDKVPIHVAVNVADGDVVAVKCADQQLTLAYRAATSPKGKDFTIKARVDKNPIVETTGRSVDGQFVQIEATADLVKQMRAGKETALRVIAEDGSAITSVFRMDGAAKAFAGLAKDCKVD